MVDYLSADQAVCRCDVFVASDGKEALCATAQGTIARLSGTGTPVAAVEPLASCNG